MELTPTMRQALAEIEREPGKPAADYPGGRQTVHALMKRGKAEVQGDAWHTFTPEHAHVFKPGIHADGCHFFANGGRCECGVMYSTNHERSIAFDPWSLEWLMPDICQRCEELLKGARPRATVVVFRTEA